MKYVLIGNKINVDQNLLEKVAKAAFSCLEASEGEIELKFLSKKEIKELNNTYRGINKETDVLSFQIAEKPLIGQIFICYNIAKQQAEKNNKTVEDEICLLLVHGILHIFDYDHALEDDESEMQELETKILAKVGRKR